MARKLAAPLFKEVPLCLAISLSLAASQALGQGKQNAGSPTSQSSGSSGGITYLRGDMVTELSGDHLVVLCYELTPTGSPSQPYTLTPTIIDAHSNPECFRFADQFQTPLVSKNKLVVKIHGKALDFDQFKTFTINVTTQVGTAINPTPLRPMMSTAAASSAAPGGETRPEYETNYLIWPFKLQGDTIPTVGVSGLYAPGISWKPGTVFSTGTMIVATPDNRHLYAAVQGGVTASAAPAFPVITNAKVVDGTVVWQEAGSLTPPAGATITTSTGTSPTDQTISLLSLGLPQVHALSYYNVSFGVVVSSLRNPNFVRTQVTPSPNPTYKTTKDNGPITVAPILAFTAYILPLDAERDWRPRDLWPGVTVGFSLADPANSFFFGGSSEIRRNVQLTYGVNVGKINTLAPGIQDPTSSAAPPTSKKFGTGGFVGMTVNFDFIKGLFGGSGSKS
jgi:hypothetical protein